MVASTKENTMRPVHRSTAGASSSRSVASRRLVLAAACGFGLLLAAFALARSKDGATVSGRVVFHGQTVSSGSIIALSDDGTARTGVILPDGTYKVEGLKP